jgi:hypothetical protein
VGSRIQVGEENKGVKGAEKQRFRILGVQDSRIQVENGEQRKDSR